MDVILILRSFDLQLEKLSTQATAYSGDWNYLLCICSIWLHPRVRNAKCYESKNCKRTKSIKFLAQEPKCSTTCPKICGQLIITPIPKGLPQNVATMLEAHSCTGRRCMLQHYNFSSLEPSGPILFQHDNALCTK